MPQPLPRFWTPSGRALGTLFGLALLVCARLAAAQGQDPHVVASLVAEAEWVQPGVPLEVALRFEIEDEWHTYWSNPGDAGLPTRIRWDLPEGFEAGEIRWPAPEPVRLGPLVSYGYSDEVLHLVTLQVPPDLAGDAVTLRARVDWLECKDLCLPGKDEVELSLPVRQTEAPKGEWAPAFARARALLPREPAGWSTQAHVSGAEAALAFVPPPDVAAALTGDVRFYPHDSEVLDYAAEQKLGRTAAGFRLDMARATEPAEVEVLRGVLVLHGASDVVAFEIAAPTSPDPPPAVVADVPVSAAPPAVAPLGLAVALIFSFVGGLILNLMPCVLPVLSLKVMGLVRQAGEDHRSSWLHGLAFAAGVLAFFWVLAGALLALRAGGEQIGWGFQLQSPGFVAFLACLFFLIGLNLFGVFEVGESLTAAGGLGQGRSGLASSFWGGALVTIVATPCTAPFMGSALGFALGQPAWVTLLVFSGLGFGMASPYLLLSAFPRLMRFLPRPGAWMETFKQFMGFVMMGTVVAVLWLFGRQAGIDALTLLLAGLVVIGLGAWVYGRGTAPGVEGPRRVRATLAAAVIVALGLALGFSRAQAAPVEAGRLPDDDAGIAWQPWSAERVAELRAAGTPVFVDFTADWCLSCQVNEHVAFGSAEVQNRFREAGIVALKADWTLRDEGITRALAAHGRQGVPLYVLYAPGRPPQLLPELLTPGIVLQALEDLS